MRFNPLESLRGIVTVLNTPFNAEGDPDPPALARHVAYALDAGVAGFLVPAMASEVGRLTARERSLVVDTVLSATAGRVPVVGGASAPTREERRSRASELLKAGCSCILAAIPWRNGEEFLADIEDLAGLDPPCLMVQDWDAAGPGIPIEWIAKGFERVPAFRSIKVETAMAGKKYSAILEASQGKMHVCGGWAVTQMIEGLDRGIHAFMPTGLHRSYVGIYTSYMAGDRAEATRLFERLLPILAFSNQHLDVSIRFFKRLLWLQGIYPTPSVREPLEALDAWQLRLADELARKAIKLEADAELKTMGRTKA